MDEVTKDSGRSRPLSVGEFDTIFSRLHALQRAEEVANPHRSLEVYNFSRAGNISNDQMRAIGAVNETFARNLTHSGGAWLRTEFQVTQTYCKQMQFTDFIGHVTREGTRDMHLSLLRLEPLGAVGVLELELTLAAPIVDLLLGGTGKGESGTPQRMLTEIEDLILSSVVAMILTELNMAWQGVGLQFLLEQREPSSQAARVMPAGEKTLAVSFEIAMPEARGSLNLCIPAVVLNTLLRNLSAERDQRRRRSDEARTRVRELVGEATVGSVLQFPPIRLSAREIALLVPGYVLRLPLPRHAPAELRVAGLPLGKARPVKLGEHRGACMEPFAPADGIAKQEISA